MIRLCSVLAVLLTVGAVWTPGSVWSETPPRVAVVIGNAAYAGMPALPECAASAGAISDALTKIGFDVLRADNASNGGVGGSLGAMYARLHAAAGDGTPGGAAVVYVCGYMRDFEQRSFFLPVDADIDRPTDLLAQGVLPSAFLDAVTRSGAKAGMVLLDLVNAPGQGDPLAGPSGLPTSLEPSFGLAATVHPQSQGSTGAKPVVTPLAVAASSALAAPHPEVGSVLGAIRDRLRSAGRQPTIDLPSEPAPLEVADVPAIAATAPQADAGSSATTARAVPPIGADVTPVVPAAPPISSAAPPVALAAPSAPAAPPVALAAPSAPVTPPVTPSVTPAALSPPVDITTIDGRRSLQADLLRLGYYDGPVDGIFGPGSLAAIRRLQHELRDPRTGILSPAEIIELQARSR